jgi:hypothetical protein
MTPAPSLPSTWSGSFTDLVDKANSLWKQLSPGSAPITERLARHYQQTGLLGRGVRHGRSSEFSARDVASLVSAKSLAHERWPLEQVQKLLSIDMSALSNEYSSSGSPSAFFASSSMDTSHAYFMGNATLSPSNSPVSLVDRLMAQAQSASPPVPRSMSSAPFLLSAEGAQASLASSKSGVLRSTLASITNTPDHLLEANSSSDLSGAALTLNSLYRQNLSDRTSSVSTAPALPPPSPAHIIDLDSQLQVLQRSTAPRDRRRHAGLLRRLADQWDPPKS